MEVGKIGRDFDLVVSSGVLHHLKDPEKGLIAIRDVMKPGGRMNISLYSKIARDYALNPASEYIREKGYTSSSDDIRTFRHDLMKLPEGDPRRRCIRASDFFMLSECNDLLFHVQEHRFTFLTLKALTEKNGLELFHIYMAPPTLKKWEKKYPDDPVRFDFERLHEFEVENPDAFLEMYKVYFHHKGEDSPHQLDPLIRAGLI
jgi:SAM-dependent methyltransferase